MFIIDDEEISLFLTQRMLLHHFVGADIHPFISAEEALSSLKEDVNHPEVILLDLNMPVMSGWEFLEGVGALGGEFRKECRIYVLTSSLDSSDEEAIKSHPLVSGLMHKPISIENIKLLYPAI